MSRDEIGETDPAKRSKGLPCAGCPKCGALTCATPGNCDEEEAR